MAKPRRDEGSPLMLHEMEEIVSAARPGDVEAPMAAEAALLTEATAGALCQSGCLSDPQATALTALRARQVRLFADAVNDERFAVAHSYVDPDDGVPRVLLAAAVQQWNTRNDTPFVRLLLAAGADPCAVDEVTEEAPIHDIARKASPELFDVCLPFVKDPNVQNGEGLTPLHALMEQLSESDEPGRAKIINMTRTFLERCRGVEPNAEDLRGQLTPLYYAASAGSAEAVKLLLEHGADPEVNIEGSSIREVIQENIGKDFDFMAFADKVKSVPIKQKVFNCCESGDVNGLLRLSKAETATAKGNVEWNCNNGAMTPLQLACVHGHDNVVSFLLSERDCDPNLTAPGEGRTPLLIAAHHGYFNILDVMKRSPRVDFGVVEKATGKTVLHEVFLGDSSKAVGGLSMQNSSYPKCLKVLLGKGYDQNPGFERQISGIINYQETLDGNTALHYATMQPDQGVVRSLLGRGANMGVKNWRDKAAVQAILPDTIRDFLDGQCIRGDGVVTDEDFKVTFTYDFLAPPVLGKDDGRGREGKDEEGEREEEGEEDKPALPETEALWYLAKASKEHRSLLKHPVIASFLWLKWQRIRTLFYSNLIIYLAFVILLTAYIFIRFGGKGVQPTGPTIDEAGGLVTSGDSVNGADANLATALTVPLALLLIVLLLREIFQMLVSFRRYFFSPENLLELAIIVLSCIILFDSESGGDHYNRNRHLAALCVLFTWTECLVMVGRHPRLSTNVTMFATVVVTFLQFLLWYGIIIVAFGIAFYIMMHTDYDGGKPQDEDYRFFDFFWLALFKTSAMFVGELEFADIPFTDNTISYLVFVAFIFLIVVVLMNLLNGLAVSDTGLIREEAEVVGWSARVDLITYTESMLLGDPFYFLSNWPPYKLLQRIPNCAVCRFLYKYPRVRDVLQKISGGTKILLFYTCLPNRRASFYPNRKSSRSILRYKKSLKVEDGNEPGNGQKLFISNDVLDSAKTVLLERMKREEEEAERRAEQEEISNRLLLIEEMLLQMQAKQQA